jgi:hypothetical protein
MGLNYNKHWARWEVDCLGKIEEICMGSNKQFFTFNFIGTVNKEHGRRASELEQEGEANSGACWSVLGAKN